MRQATQGEVLFNDDTVMRILGKAPQAKEGRKAVYTSAILSRLGSNRIALFITGHNHAGENLGAVLQQRAASLSAPIQMCDALAANTVGEAGELNAILAHCLAHARRRFVGVGTRFPEGVNHLLAELKVVYRNDAWTSYRDTFRLLLAFASERLHKAPSGITMEELSPAFLGEFLRHPEVDRGNGARTRNGRLSALRAFFRFVTMAEPGLALQCQQVLAVPAKRYDRDAVAFLDKHKVAALLAAPDRRTWMGRRDRILLLVAIQTGLRNNEITSLRWQDVGLGVGAHVKCLGKGRKTRCTPLRPDVTEALQQWFSKQREAPASPVFPSSRGGPLSADALQHLVIWHVSTACEPCPTLAKKHVTPHTLRHTAAMDLLRRGVDLSVIALWLGHESSETTQIYLHTDMGIKEKALAHATWDGQVPGRYLPSDPLLTFLEALCLCRLRNRWNPGPPWLLWFRARSTRPNPGRGITYSRPA